MFNNNLSGLSLICNGQFQNILIGPNQNDAAIIKGNLRFNTSTNSYQFYDGSTWETLDTSGNASLWETSGTGITIKPKSTYTDGIQIDKINSISGSGIEILDDINCAGIISKGPYGASSWLTAAFGLNAGNKVVCGTEPLGNALIGGHTSTLGAWAPLNIQRYNDAGTGDLNIGGSSSNVYNFGTFYSGNIGCITSNGNLYISTNGSGSLILGSYTNTLPNSGVDVEIGQNSKMIYCHGQISLSPFAFKSDYEGSICYDYSAHLLKFHNGTVWKTVDTNGIQETKISAPEVKNIDTTDINIDKLFVNSIIPRTITKTIQISASNIESLELGDNNKKGCLGMDQMGFYYCGNSVKYYLANRECNNTHNIANDTYKYIQTRHKDIYNMFTELKKEINNLKKEINSLKTLKIDDNLPDEIANITDLGNSLNFVK